MLDHLVFYGLSALILGSALGTVLNRNTVHSSLLLGLSLAGVAGIFASLGADFLFAAQIMVYVSGIAVLIMFAVMLLGRASDLHLRQVNELWLAALLVCAIAAFGFMRLARPFAGFYSATTMHPATADIGRLFLGDYLVPFELISIVLTAALLGAVFFSHADKPEAGR